MLFELEPVLPEPLLLPPLELEPFEPVLLELLSFPVGTLMLPLELEFDAELFAEFDPFELEPVVEPFEPLLLFSTGLVVVGVEVLSDVSLFGFTTGAFLVKALTFM